MTLNGPTPGAAPSEPGAALPELSPLQRARVTIVGVGALGHVVALDLARAGVGHLHVLDPDLVTPDTASRQLPLTRSGEYKVVALKAVIREYDPWASVEAVAGSIGGARPTASLLDGRVTHLIDATAEPAVTRFLAHWAAARQAGFYSVSATAGGLGGVVLALDDPVGTSCFECFEHHRSDGSLPVPPELRGGWVIPPRCGQATFLGFGHDLALVAHQATRRVLAGITDPQAHHPAYSVANIPADGEPPTWRTAEVGAHSRCSRRHTGVQLQLLGA